MNFWWSTHYQLSDAEILKCRLTEVICVTNNKIDLENIVLLYMNFMKSKRKQKTKKMKCCEIPKMCVCGPALVKLKNNVLKGTGSGMCALNIRGWRRHPGADMGWWCGVEWNRNPCPSWVPRMLAFSQWLTSSVCQSPLRDREGGGQCRTWTYLSNGWGRLESRQLQCSVMKATAVRWTWHSSLGTDLSKKVCGWRTESGPQDGDKLWGALCNRSVFTAAKRSSHWVW